MSSSLRWFHLIKLKHMRIHMLMTPALESILCYSKLLHADLCYSKLLHADVCYSKLFNSDID